MASFTDDFQYANDTAFTANWEVINQSDAGAGVTVEQSGGQPLYFATNTASGAAARAIYTAATPTTAAQQVTAEISTIEELTVSGSAADPNGAYVEIGAGSAQATTAFATDLLGFYLRFAWESDSVRTVSLRERLRGGTDQELASVTLVQAGGVVPESYSGVLIEDGGLDEIQEVRLIVTASNKGAFVRGYVNQDDDDHPTIQAYSKSDFIPPTTTTGDFGAWWFGFGGTTSARALGVGYFSGGDYDNSTDRAPQTLREDQVTLATLRKRIETKLAQPIGATLKQDHVDDAIRDAIDEILLRAGDKAWFMHRTEEVSVTPDTLGLATMNPKMERVLEIMHSDSGAAERFKIDRITTSGALVILFPSRLSKTYRITYKMRYEQMSEDDDVCPIPRPYTELVVYQACMRLLEGRNKQAMEDRFTKRAMVLEQLMKRDLNRYSDWTRTVIQPRRRMPIYRNRIYLRG